MDITLVGTVVAAVTVALMVGYRHYLEGQKQALGLKVLLSPTSPRRGEKLTVTIEYCPQSACALQSLALELICEEKVQRERTALEKSAITQDASFSKQHYITDVRIVHRLGGALVEQSIPLPAGETRRFETGLDIPGEGPVTQEGTRQVHWTLTVRSYHSTLISIIHSQNLVVQM